MCGLSNWLYSTTANLFVYDHDQCIIYRIELRKRIERLDELYTRLGIQICEKIPADIVW